MSSYLQNLVGHVIRRKKREVERDEREVGLNLLEVIHKRSSIQQHFWNDLGKVMFDEIGNPSQYFTLAKTKSGRKYFDENITNCENFVSLYAVCAQNLRFAPAPLNSIDQPLGSHKLVDELHSTPKQFHTPHMFVKYWGAM